MVKLRVCTPNFTIIEMHQTFLLILACLNCDFIFIYAYDMCIIFSVVIASVSSVARNTNFTLFSYAF